MTDTGALDHPGDEHQLDPDIGRAIEAVVMVAEQPVPPALLAQLCDIDEALIEAHCAALADDYENQQRGFTLARVAGGYRFQSHADQAPYVERYVLEGQSSRLSAAALETLAIVAYKQPISRAQVAAIRGVNVDAVMRTLDQRGYIAEIARDPGPGQAVLFGTTQLFLEKVGLDSLHDLPGLGDFVPGPEVVEQLETGLRVDDGEPPLDHDNPGEAEVPVAVPDVDVTDEADGDGEPALDHDNPGEAEVPVAVPDVDVTDQADGDSDPPLDHDNPGEADAPVAVPDLDITDEGDAHPGQSDAVVIAMPDRFGRGD